tara:strand:- start:145 stop:393 length:249 start_codon:yes stop_codon:yes gene_type:complete
MMPIPDSCVGVSNVLSTDLKDEEGERKDNVVPPSPSIISLLLLLLGKLFMDGDGDGDGDDMDGDDIDGDGILVFFAHLFVSK